MKTQSALAGPGPLPAAVIDPPRRMGDRYFEYARVDGTADLEKTYRIRYQVYCLERGFLPPSSTPTTASRTSTTSIHCTSWRVMSRVRRRGRPAWP